MPSVAVCLRVALCLQLSPRTHEGLAAMVTEPAAHAAGLCTSQACSVAPQNCLGTWGLDGRATAVTRSVQLSCGAPQPSGSFGGSLFSQPR